MEDGVLESDGKPTKKSYVEPNPNISSHPVLIGIKYCFYWFRLGRVYAYWNYQNKIF